MYMQKGEILMRPVTVQEIEQKIAMHMVNYAPSNKSILKAADTVKEFNISLRNRKYVNKASNLIEDMWTKIRKGELNMDSPKITIKPKKSPSAILSPVYNTSDGELLLEILDKKFTEKIYMDRRYFKDFRYEKTVYTDHGSATLKYTDSRVTKDDKIAHQVNERINLYLDELFSPLRIQKYFTKDEL